MPTIAWLAAKKKAEEARSKKTDKTPKEKETSSKPERK